MAKTWQPTSKRWGDRSYQEVMERFPDKINTAGVALCVWAYAQDAAFDLNKLRELAKSDKDIGAISGRTQGSARKILGMSALTKRGGKKRGRKRQARTSTGTAPKTSENLVLSHPRLERLNRRLGVAFAAVDEYAAARKQLDRAAKKINSVDLEVRRVLAGIDEDAAEVFKELGLK